MTAALWLIAAIASPPAPAQTAAAPPVDRAVVDFPAPEPDLATFRREVEPVLKRFCFDCHDRATREADLALDALNANLLDSTDLEAWRAVFEQLRDGDMPPSDADQPSAAQRAAVLNWLRNEFAKLALPGMTREPKLHLPEFGNFVDHAALFDVRRPHVIPGPPRIWRLRPEAYETLLRSVNNTSQLPPLAKPFALRDGPEFRDYASLYFVDEPTTEMLINNAEVLADVLLQRSRSREIRRLGDSEVELTDDVLGAAIVSAYQALMRRGPTEDETAELLRLYRRVEGRAGRRLAVRTLLSAILLNPRAIYREELGDGQADALGRVRLSPRELAYALSFALGEQLDETALRRARAGELDSPAAVAEYVRERLRHPERVRGGNPRVLEFFREYFGYPNATNVFKDRPARAPWEPALLVRDLDILIEETVRADHQVLQRLLTTNRYYVGVDRDRDGRIVRRKYPLEYPTIYGLPPDWIWTAEQPVAFPDDRRSGVLTHPAWLAAWSGNFDNKPVQRGKWIRTHLLGGTVPDLPIGVDARVPEAPDKTFRQRLESVTRQTLCWRCHKKMDPLGLPFEQYDHYGRFRRFEAGKPVRVDGRIDRTDWPDLHGDVPTPRALVHGLANRVRVEQVFVRHAFRFFLGRNETLGDANTLQDAHRAYRESRGSFRELVVALLSSESFLLRQLPRQTPADAQRARPAGSIRAGPADAADR